MSTLPEYRFSRLRFYAPVGVAKVQVEGENVIGKWRDPLQRYYGEVGKTVAERFANWGWEANQIVEFTRKYGPLTQRPYQRAHGSHEFSFSLESWTHNQWELLKLWASMRHGGAEITRLLELGQAEMRNGWLHFGCGSLFDFMLLELLNKREKLRFCRRPECGHPHFIAQHGKEEYCSTDCANWAQSKWKKEWHKVQRQKRLMKEKGGKRGTRQTR
jgi:hypothetical protein